MQRSFDVVVIGAGPAGLAAAAGAAEAGVTTLAVDRMGPGGQLINLGHLRDVADLAREAGLEDTTSGPDLVAWLAERAMSSGAELAFDEVASISLTGEGFRLECGEGPITAKAVVIATGLTPGTTGLAGEEQFIGRGISHCAHCDAPLFRGAAVVVAGCDEWALAEAEVLAAEVASLTIVADRASTVPDAAVRALGGARGLTVEVIEGVITQLNGDESGLSGVVVGSPDGARSDSARTLAATGLFPHTGRTPALALLGSLPRTAPGLFLAGDATIEDGRSGRQRITRAVAEGRAAGQNAARYALTSA